MRPVFALMSLMIATPAAAQGPVCPSVQGRIDAEAIKPHRAHELLLLAPHLGPSTIKPLLEKADGADLEGARAAYLAVGLARHAEALRALSSRPWPTTRPQRLGRALALLALGDGSATGTIAAALRHPDREVRLQTAWALYRMKQKRPRTLLYEALEDVDPAVRLVAARVHLKLGSRRARKVLLELFDGSDPLYQPIAARILLRAGVHLRPEQLSRLAPEDQARAYALLDLRGRRPLSKNLKTAVLSKSPAERAGAFAALAVVGELSVPVLRRTAKKTEELYGPAGTAELTMAAALLGDGPALDALVTLNGAEAERAVQVLWAFAGADEADRRLGAEQARLVAKAVERWTVTGALAAPWESRALAAVERLDLGVGQELARTRVLGPDGPGLRTAVRILGRGASPSDLATILGVAGRGEPKSRVAALRAAAHVCRLLES